MNIDAMTDEQKRIAIAELYGISSTRFRFWYCGHDNKKPFRYFDTRKEAETDRRKELKWGCGEVEEFTDLERIPDYLNSLDAMHEAEERLYRDHVQAEAYFKALEREVSRTKHSGTALGFQLINATARQRADAFLKVLT